MGVYADGASRPVGPLAGLRALSDLDHLCAEDMSRGLYRYFPAADAGANPGGTLAHGAPFAAKS
jgi:hypothetical protein